MKPQYSLEQAPHGGVDGQMRKDRHAWRFESHLSDAAISIPPIRPCVDHVPGLGFSCYAPSQILGLIAVLGGVQRSCRNVDPAFRQFDDLDEFRYDPVALAAATIINTMAAPDRGDGGIQSGLAESVGACLHAENRFGEVFDAIVRNEVPDIVHAGVPGRFQIIADDSYKPVILRKLTGFGVVSAMNLQDILINGVFAPAGSILSLEHTQDGPDKRPDEDVFLLPQNGIQKVGLLRMSAFSLPEGWRQTYFAETFENVGPGISPRLMNNMRMRDIAEAVQGVLDDYLSGGVWFDWAER
jgi:hypothetical protein